MNITGPHTTLLPATSMPPPRIGGRPPIRGGQQVAPQAQSVVQDASRTAHGGRPVRINRASEDAAMFAYNRQAQIHLDEKKAQIDEYV